jgi:hypothetical protein
MSTPVDTRFVANGDDIVFDTVEGTMRVRTGYGSHWVKMVLGNGRLEVSYGGGWRRVTADERAQLTNCTKVGRINPMTGSIRTNSIEMALRDYGDGILTLTAY